MAEKKAPVATPDVPNAPQADSSQEVETKAYIPTYKIKPELKQAVLKAVGKYPFNQIASIMNAINVEVMDHNTLTNVINVMGNFPYQDVSQLLSSINDYIEMIPEE